MKYLPRPKKTSKRELNRIAKALGLSHNCYAYERTSSIENNDYMMPIGYCWKCLSILIEYPIRRLTKVTNRKK